MAERTRKLRLSRFSGRSVAESGAMAKFWQGRSPVLGTLSESVRAGKEKVPWHSDGKKQMETYTFKYMFIGFVMDAISYTAARANLVQTMKQVCSEHEP